MMCQWACGILLACALLAGCTSVDAPQAQVQRQLKMLAQQIDLGVGYLRMGDYRRAREKLHRALEIEPESGIAHTTLGLLLELQGEYLLAERHFKSALRFEPDLTQARNNYGAFLYAQQRYAEAVEQLQAATEDPFYPHRAAVFENLGAAWHKLGDSDEAAQSFLHATQLNPDQPRALLELAEIRLGEQKLEEASKLYYRYANVADHSARSLRLCVKVAGALGDEPEAAACKLALQQMLSARGEPVLNAFGKGQRE